MYGRLNSSKSGHHEPRIRIESSVVVIRVLFGIGRGMGGRVLSTCKA
jgi:hypothetical protein